MPVLRACTERMVPISTHEGMTMHLITKRFEIELYRDSLWLRLSFFGRTFQTFRDFSGNGMSATNWLKNTRHTDETESTPASA